MSKIKIGVLGILALLLILSSFVFATGTLYYETTTPTFGDKTARSGTKDTTTNQIFMLSNPTSAEFFSW